MITARDEIRPATWRLNLNNPSTTGQKSNLGDCNFAAATDALAATFQKTLRYVHTILVPRALQAWRHAPASFPQIKHRAGTVGREGLGH